VQIAGEHYHFRCAKHAVDGHFEVKDQLLEAKCSVLTCESRARCYWYRGAQFEKLPEPSQ
jgi:hypothetical protein